MYFTLDTSGTVTSVNQFGAQELGYQIDELVGESVLKVFFEEDRQEVMKQFNKLLNNPADVHHWRFRKIRKDGTMLWVEEYARVVSDANGSISVLIVCQDITEKKN